MLLYIAAIASAVGAQVAAADAGRRAEQGLPPLPTPPPPTWKDKCAEVVFWVLVLSPGFMIASCVGMAGYVAVKIAFAKHGIAFP